MHGGRQLAPIQIHVLRPLGRQDQSVGIFGDGLRSIAEVNTGIGAFMAGTVEGDGIVAAHFGATVGQPPADVEGGGVAQIVGVRLEGQAQNADGFAFENALASSL